MTSLKKSTTPNWKNIFRVQTRRRPICFSPWTAL